MARSVSLLLSLVVPTQLVSAAAAVQLVGNTHGRQPRRHNATHPQRDTRADRRTFKDTALGEGSPNDIWCSAIDTVTHGDQSCPRDLVGTPACWTYKTYIIARRTQPTRKQIDVWHWFVFQSSVPWVLCFSLSYQLNPRDVDREWKPVSTTNGRTSGGPAHYTVSYPHECIVYMCPHRMDPDLPEQLEKVSKIGKVSTVKEGPNQDMSDYCLFQDTNYEEVQKKKKGLFSSKKPNKEFNCAVISYCGNLFPQPDMRSVHIHTPKGKYDIYTEPEPKPEHHKETKPAEAAHEDTREVAENMKAQKTPVSEAGNAGEKTPGPAGHTEVKATDENHKTQDAPAPGASTSHPPEKSLEKLLETPGAGDNAAGNKKTD